MFKSKESFHCEMCDKRFSSIENMKTHNSEIHGNLIHRKSYPIKRPFSKNKSDEKENQIFDLENWLEKFNLGMYFSISGIRPDSKFDIRPDFRLAGYPVNQVENELYVISARCDMYYQCLNLCI